MDVNSDLVASGNAELLLMGGFSLASFTADRDALQQAIDAIGGLENARVLMAGDRDANKRNMVERMRQFRAAVRIHMEGSRYERTTPPLPHRTMAESKFLRPLGDMQDVWGRINAATDIPEFTPPLTLRGGYTLDGFSADLQALRDAFAAVAEAENEQSMARRQRDEMLGPLRERMVQYRAAVELEFGAEHPFTESLPAITRRSKRSTGW
jgi:hypothetical protein